VYLCWPDLCSLFMLQMLVSFYGVEPAFPLTTHLITRSLETTFPKRLYYVSSSVYASFGCCSVACAASKLPVSAFCAGALCRTCNLPAASILHYFALICTGALRRSQLALQLMYRG
jgi:hypothetical protein